MTANYRKIQTYKCKSLKMWNYRNIEENKYVDTKNFKVLNKKNYNIQQYK